MSLYGTLYIVKLHGSEPVVRQSYKETVCVWLRKILEYVLYIIITIY